MEVDVVDDARVGEGQSHVRHPRQLAVHQDLPRHVASHHEPVGVDAAVDLLDDVQVDLVVRVLDSLPPPPDAAQHALGQVAVQVALVADPHARRHTPEDGGRDDHRLEDVGFGCHRDPVVHHLVHDLIHSDEVLLDALLADFVEVVPEHVHHPVKELSDEQRDDISLYDGDEEHPVSLHVDHVVLGCNHHRLHLRRVRCLLYLIPEQLAAGPADVSPVMLLDDDLSRRRHDKDRVDHARSFSRFCCPAGSCSLSTNLLLQTRLFVHKTLDQPPIR
mmetsp:Transcript_23720/g.77227  ORF Transcript_23720/g.77227 Transcript_23720/m.77227 type:complete len:275 (-) Transcript_23720:44-868(-)